MSAWKRPRGNLMWNNRPVGQLWRALMCETPIKRFAGMATKHFTFKYGSQFVLHNSINITKVGWRLRSGNQPIRRKPTQTQQRRQHFAQAFVLITSCWQKLIKTEKVTKQSGWHTVYPGGNSSHKAYCLPETAFLWCALMCIAFAGPRRLVLVCFMVAVTARRRVRLGGLHFLQWLSPHDTGPRAELPNFEDFFKISFLIYRDYILACVANSCCMKGYFILD